MKFKFYLIVFITFIFFNYSQDIFSKNLIKVTFPNGNEWLRAGVSWNYKIRWVTLGDIDKVKIEYSIDGGKSYQVIADSVENTGRYIWKLPKVNTDNALIRVSSIDGSVSDTSDSLFHILYFPNTAKIKFNVTINTFTPKNDYICIGFDWRGPIKMNKIGENQWEAVIDFYPIGDTVTYKYCRNCECSSADEYFPDVEIGWRKLPVTQSSIEVNDTVNRWRWLPQNGEVPSIDTSKYVKEKPDYIKHNDFMAGIMLADYWRHGWIDSLDTTLNRVSKFSNANWVEYSPVPEIVQFYPVPLIDKEGNNATSEEDLIEIIEKVHSHGLKLFLNPFPWALYVSDNSTQNHSKDWWNAFQEQWGKIMLYYAKIAEKYGVEMLGFRMWMNIENISDDEKSIVNSLAIQTLEKIRNIYHGKIAVNFSIHKADMDVFKYGDYLSMSLWTIYPWLLCNGKDSIDKVSTNLKNHIENELDKIRKEYNKNIIIGQIAAASYSNACEGEPDFETQSPYFKDDKNVQLDLQEQADIYEMFFKIISQYPWIKGTFSFGYQYWDSIDKSPSVRWKPAENVLGKWYKWLTVKEIPFYSLEGLKFSDNMTLPNPEKNLIKISSGKYAVTPSLIVPDDLKGKKVKLLFYVYFPSLNQWFHLPDKDKIISDEQVKFDNLVDAVDFSNLKNFKFQIWYGVQYKDSIYFNVYTVEVD